MTPQFHKDLEKAIQKVFKKHKIPFEKVLAQVTWSMNSRFVPSFKFKIKGVALTKRKYEEETAL